MLKNGDTFEGTKDIIGNKEGEETVTYINGDIVTTKFKDGK